MQRRVYGVLPMIRLCFLMRQLNVGGAQRQLIELVKELDKSRYDITVVTFYDGGQLRPEMASVPSVRLVSMDKGGRWDVVPFFLRLVKTIRSVHPDILHGYLGVANLLCVALGPFVGRPRVVWGARASFKELGKYDRFTRVAFLLERICSRFPDLIIANSIAGRDFYVSQGFPLQKTTMVPNGIDVSRFRPDTGAREKLRSEWGIEEAERVIGLVGRLDPRKDHPTFLTAASMLAGERKDVRFVCVGDGPPEYRRRLQSLGESLGLKDRLIWTGARADMAAVYNAMDLLTSASAFGEGFPNVIGEAMACGVPCVATDVGDSRSIVGNTGVVVTAGDPTSLCDGWRRILDLPGDRVAALGEEARARVVAEFGREALALRTSKALEALL